MKDPERLSRNETFFFTLETFVIITEVRDQLLICACSPGDFVGTNLVLRHSQDDKARGIINISRSSQAGRGS
jgi:hypothetical protein